MGNAFVAQANDPSAIYYNPAGIVQIESTQVYARLIIIAGNISCKSDRYNRGTFPGETTDIKYNTFFVPFATLPIKSMTT